MAVVDKLPTELWLEILKEAIYVSHLMDIYPSPLAVTPDDFVLDDLRSSLHVRSAVARTSKEFKSLMFLFPYDCLLVTNQNADHIARTFSRFDPARAVIVSQRSSERYLETDSSILSRSHQACGHPCAPPRRHRTFRGCIRAQWEYSRSARKIQTCLLRKAYHRLRWPPHRQCTRETKSDISLRVHMSKTYILMLAIPAAPEPCPLKGILHPRRQTHTRAVRPC
ncbi:hypothetical protein OF83DRAFT_808496 [Amylostereum chailletii]|nr:hypothetical protein OF83DRAFT_808496 [Amylostereum chailletii]